MRDRNAFLFLGSYENRKLLSVILQAENRPSRANSGSKTRFNGISNNLNTFAIREDKKSDAYCPASHVVAIHV